MLEILPESSGNVIGARVGGRLGGDECKLLAGRIEALIEEHKTVRLLLDVSECDRVDPAAAWEEFVMGVKHWNDLERIAIVGGAKWSHAAANTLNRLAHGEAEHFSAAELAGAWVWVRR